MKKLPIGIQNLNEIRTQNHYYVDKTAYAHKLITSGKYYFLSRPRRFGKSLFVDTLKEVFSGNRDLFKGLYIEKRWQWENTFPVISISFGSGVIQSRHELDIRIEELMEEYTELYDIELKKQSIAGRFSELIASIYKKAGPVVLLIDEYDKPILDNITNPNVAIEIREGLKNCYSVIKDADRFLKFAFLTGVSKFSRVNLFSGLNNLQDITLDNRYSNICGYTHEDLLTIFKDRLNGLETEEIRKWYNGYSWLGEEKVYNPFDVLLLLDTREFRNYWFETGTPSFLIELLQEKHYYIPELENLEAGEELIGSFDVDRIEPETLLFQAGYLTIESVRQTGARRSYQLTYPNLEVKMSFSDFMLSYLSKDVAQKDRTQNKLNDVLSNADLQTLKDIFKSFFSSIPYDWYRKNELAGYEGYYSSIFYCYFTALGLEVIPEDTTNYGRIDMTVKIENKVYIFEFKVVDLTTGNIKPLEQIKNRKYYQKYMSENDDIYLVGVEFSKKDRNIVGFEWECLSK